jgi:hypothetical protein
MKSLLSIFVVLEWLAFSSSIKAQITIVSPTQGGIISICANGTNRQITVVLSSTVSTNIWLELNSYATPSNLPPSFVTVLSFDALLTPGTVTNVYTLYDDFYTFEGGNSFSLSVATENSDYSITPKYESLRFHISDIPAVWLYATNSDEQVWRPGQTKHFQCAYSNMPPGIAYQVDMSSADEAVPWPGEAYGFIVATDMVNDSNGVLNLEMPVPSGAIHCQHLLQIRFSNEARDFYLPVYVGSSNAPTVVRMDSLQWEPSHDDGRTVWLQAEGLPDASYDVQASTNMVNWQTVSLSPLSSPSGSLPFREDVSEGNSDRFYRLKQIP